MRVTPLKSNPKVIDEIVAENVSIHIERMGAGAYWMRIGDRIFSLNTLVPENWRKKKGVEIAIMEERDE